MQDMHQMLGMNRIFMSMHKKAGNNGLKKTGNCKNPLPFMIRMGINTKLV